jgi:hypothetical protein
MSVPGTETVSRESDYYRAACEVRCKMDAYGRDVGIVMLADYADAAALIAAAIRDAALAEREACARVAEEAQRFHDDRCPSPRDCRCADGHHVAVAIRARGGKS